MLKKIYLMHNIRISGNDPSKIDKINVLMDLDLSFTSLHDNIPSEFFLIKDLCYLGIFYPRIHGPISAKLEKCTRSNTSPLNCCSLLHGFYDFQGNSPVLVGFTHILILMLKGLTKYLSSCQVYFSCKIPPCQPMIYKLHNLKTNTYMTNIYDS